MIRTLGGPRPRGSHIFASSQGNWTLIERIRLILMIFFERDSADQFNQLHQCPISDECKLLATRGCACSASFPLCDQFRYKDTDSVGSHPSTAARQLRWRLRSGCFKLRHPERRAVRRSARSRRVPSVMVHQIHYTRMVPAGPASSPAQGLIRANAYPQRGLWGSKGRSPWSGAAGARAPPPTCRQAAHGRDRSRLILGKTP